MDLFWKKVFSGGQMTDDKMNTDSEDTQRCVSDFLKVTKKQRLFGAMGKCSRIFEDGLYAPPEPGGSETPVIGV